MTRSVRYIFFFQAEDGIRDIGVTGVQTCALPIFQILDDLHLILRDQVLRRELVLDIDPELALRQVAHMAHRGRDAITGRSEERRVGKECRSRWSPYH